MKKGITLSILLASLIVLGGGVLSREPLQNNEGALAIYIEDEKVETIPLKGNSENYVFDHAVCMVDGKVTDEVEITWDQEAWAPVIKNLKDHSTKCNLYFVEGEVDFNSSLLACNENSNAAQCLLDNASLNPEELVLDGTVDNNLRYIGAAPNNYVTFNNELWRIIGVMNNIDDGTGVQESRLKIMKATSLGSEDIDGFSWDYDEVSRTYSNDWTTSSLMNLLNGAYYNCTTIEYYNGSSTPRIFDFTESGISDEAKAMIDNAVWNISGTTRYSDVMTTDFYTIEHSSDSSSEYPDTWIGHVALLSPSDFGFATSGGSETTRSECIYNKNLYTGYSQSECHINNWVRALGRIWTLNRLNSTENYVFYSTGSSILRMSANSYTAAVYPTVYLSSDVKIVSGNGAMESPYVLSIE